MLGARAVAAAVPADLGKALAIDADSRTGSIRDVEHVIFLMQENRSFEHMSISYRYSSRITKLSLTPGETKAQRGRCPAREAGTT